MKRIFRRACWPHRLSFFIPFLVLMHSDLGLRSSDSTGWWWPREGAQVRVLLSAYSTEFGCARYYGSDIRNNF